MFAGAPRGQARKEGSGGEEDGRDRDGIKSSDWIKKIHRSRSCVEATSSQVLPFPSFSLSSSLLVSQLFSFRLSQPASQPSSVLLILSLMSIQLALRQLHSRARQSRSSCCTASQARLLRSRVGPFFLSVFFSSHCPPKGTRVQRLAWKRSLRPSSEPFPLCLSLLLVRASQLLVCISSYSDRLL